MLKQIKGLHHVTSLASSASKNNTFFTEALGLRRVKKTVNFDNPDVYHLYYGDEIGSPGSVMTYFPFPTKSRGTKGTGEVGRTSFAVPVGTLDAWANQLSDHATNISRDIRFGENRLLFDGPDGDSFALVETDDERTPWVSPGISSDMAIRGFHSADMRIQDEGASAELLKFMGYTEIDRDDNIVRFAVENGYGADVIDIETIPSADDAHQGAGSVHHLAFAVENRARQLEVREALLDTGYRVTPVIDRNYFWAIYFRTPGGILFEVATNEPGFDVDEDSSNLGMALKLPAQHEHLRERLEKTLEPV
ncbi:MAG: VOC family protein [Boseongicola sp.]|nr:VOC family protein [Boseongicola sp.]MDD9976680.1 VOC family protein [Boseongicola sp.]